MIPKMSFESIGNAISTAAPLLASALLGPAAGTVVGLITSVFGGDPKNTNDLIKRITADPESAVKLAQIQADNIVQLQTIELQRLQVGFNEIASARQREVNLAEQNAKTGHINFTQDILAISIVMLSFSYFFCCFYFPQYKNEIVMGGAIGFVSQILGYYFGNMLKGK